MHLLLFHNFAPACQRSPNWSEKTEAVLWSGCRRWCLRRWYRLFPDRVRGNSGRWVFPFSLPLNHWWRIVCGLCSVPIADWVWFWCSDNFHCVSQMKGCSVFRCSRFPLSCPPSDWFWEKCHDCLRSSFCVHPLSASFLVCKASKTESIQHTRASLDNHCMVKSGESNNYALVLWIQYSSFLNSLHRSFVCLCNCCISFRLEDWVVVPWTTDYCRYHMSLFYYHRPTMTDLVHLDVPPLGSRVLFAKYRFLLACPWHMLTEYSSSATSPGSKECDGAFK